VALYHRTTFASNEDLELDVNAISKISMKALHLKNVAKKDSVYLSTSESTIESLVFAPEPVSANGEAPVVYARYGKGKLGWVGDVNNEAENIPVVLKMLGV
jgi:hypothetical protein